MTRSRVRNLTLAAAAATLVVGVGYALTQQTLPSDAGSTCATGANSLTATEFNTWFDSGAVTLNGAVKPANSVLFPDIPNCTFYKWSEQMFLWLTSPAPPRYGSGGLIMNTSAFYDVSLPDGGQRHFVPHTAGLIRAFNLRTAQKGMLDLPVVLEQKTLRILEIMPPVLSVAGRQVVADQNGNELEVGSARFSSTSGPVLLDVSGRVIQGPRALMRSKNDDKVRDFEKKLARIDNFDRTELVQKVSLDDRSVVLLDLFGNFPATEQGQADGGVLMAQNGSLVYYSLMVNNVFALYRTMQGATVPAGTKFPLTQTDLNAITAFAALHGQPTVIDSEALAIEIKTSWIEASSLADASQFIQMKAVVPTYDKTNPDDWVPNGTTTTTLAMVGMHIVGSTGSTNLANTNHGHPEMLWATFEHLSNGPAATYNYAKTPSGTGTVTQNTTGDWLFCANGAGAPFNEKRLKMGGLAFDHVVSNLPLHIGPANVLRTMPFGLLGTSSTGNAEVISINNKVRSLLDPADVRKNYFHEGTTWTIFGGDTFPVSNQVGTNKLENTTMETFNQGANCFSCHGSNTTAVSHVFDDTAPLF